MELCMYEGYIRNLKQLLTELSVKEGKERRETEEKIILKGFNVKFRKAVLTTELELTIRAKVSKQVRNLAYINAEILNSKGELCNEGEAIYFLMNQEKAKEMGFLHCDVEDEEITL